MIAKILGWIFIIAGIIWPILVFFAAAHASRSVDTWHEVVKPSLFGVVPILIGVALVWGI